MSRKLTTILRSGDVCKDYSQGFLSDADIVAYINKNVKETIDAINSSVKYWLKQKPSEFQCRISLPKKHYSCNNVASLYKTSDKSPKHQQ